jgi:glycosyltransferase involved in cell wall biosynthesis
MVSEFPKLSESFIINEVYELEKRGHNISVFSINRSNESMEHREIEKLNASVCYADRPSLASISEMSHEYLLNPTVLRRAVFIDKPHYLVYWLYLGDQIRKFIQKIGGVDLIHAHFAERRRLAATYAAASHDISCTVTAHAYEIFAEDNINYMMRVCPRFDHLIVPSKYNELYLSEEMGIETNISVVPATTDIEKFEPSTECVSGRLLTIGRLVEKKGYDYAIDAVSQLVEQGYDVEYHIIGSGERKDLLRDRVQEREIESHVEFLGNVSDERLEKELQKAELFVLPCVIASNGDRDVAPVALKEAMATQTACISTTISAIPELITDGKDGVLVEPNDVSALVNSIAKLIDNPEQRKTLAENGRKTVETKFDISHTVDELVSVFDTVINSKD